jgi:hypothetical protein
MGVVLFGKDTVGEYKRWVASIPADATPQSGSMHVAQMLRHLRFTFEISMGEAKGEDISNILTRTVVRWVFFHWITRWPGGKFKAPAYFTPAPEASVEVERELLEAAMDRFCTAVTAEPSRVEPSPLFGDITLDYWRRVHGVHCAHHLRQFRV